MFSISKALISYDASDKSGVLFFVPKLGQTVCLNFTLGTFIKELGHEKHFSQAQLYSQLKNLKIENVEHLWDSLISEFIVVEVS
jgi:hypothetical protein